MTKSHPKNSEISNNSGESESLWMEVELPSFPPLDTNETTDICIVGAGIVGLTCAYRLAKEGKSVIVVDQGVIGGGQTARTTAHLSWVLDDRYYELAELFGEDGAKLVAESHSAAIDYIEKIVVDEEIDCDFERVDGYLFLAPEDSKELLNKEFLAVESTGKKITKIGRAPIGDFFDTGPCLHFPRQAQFHVLKYLNGLINAILNYGGKIFSHTHINDFQDGSYCVVTTESGNTITAQAIIVATCTPVNNRFFIHTKQAPYRTYVIATALPKGSIRKGLYWDTADPYHYIRIQKHSSNPNLEWLIIGGEDHKTGQEQHIDNRYRELEHWAKQRFPMIDKIEYRWSGQVFEPVDTIAFIGKNPGDKNTYIATGDSGNGMTHGTIAGILIPDLILEKDNPWKTLYEPSRKTFSAASEFIDENLNTISQYGDWFTPGEIKTIEALKAEEGMILREGIQKIAVYKDKKNNIHTNSAFCPHLGGCVRWNSKEKSWDCPCHGSRFNGCGQMITGPANRDLYPHQSKRINKDD